VLNRRFGRNAEKREQGRPPLEPHGRMAADNRIRRLSVADSGLKWFQWELIRLLTS
jgi:hypothetical protein